MSIVLLAYLLDPLVEKLQKWKISRVMATLIVCLLAILIILPTLAFLGNMIENQIALLIKATPKYLGLIMTKIRPILASLAERFPDMQGSQIEEMVKSNIGNSLKFIGKVLSKLVSNSFALINLISLILIMPVVTFYMLRDWNTFVQKFEDLLPKKSKKNISYSYVGIRK